MDTITIGSLVRIKEEADTRKGEVGQVMTIFQQSCIVRFADGEELGYQLDDDEIEVARNV